MSGIGNFSEGVEQLHTVEVLSRTDMERLVYGTEGMVTDSRFMPKEKGGVFTYFTPGETVLSPLESLRAGETERKTFVVSKENGLVVGIAGLALNPYEEDVCWVQYVDVDPAYQEGGHGRKLIEGIFAHAQQKGLDLHGSSRTEIGEERMAHIFTQLSQEMDVVYIRAKDLVRAQE